MAVNITSRIVECPQCQAPLSLWPGRNYAQCAYCGGKFAIEWRGDDRPQLMRFESLLTATVDDAARQDASVRLADLEITIADTEDEVDLRQTELAEAKSSYREALLRLQGVIAPVQNTTYIAGLLAALAVFATLFVLKEPERLPGLVMAVLLTLMAWAFHREWQDDQRRGLQDLQAARQAITEAEGILDGALEQLEDHQLEHELLQRQILSWGEAGSPQNPHPAKPMAVASTSRTQDGVPAEGGTESQR